MIDTEIQPKPGGKALVKVRLSAMSSSIHKHRTCPYHRAEQVANRLKRDLILQKLRTYLRHRQVLVSNNYAHTDMRKLKALDRLKRFVNAYRHHSLYAVCKRIVHSSADFDAIMPGQRSAYYDNASEFYNALFSFCEEVLKAKEVAHGTV